MKIAVVCGGDSSERDVSIVTGQSVYEGLKLSYKNVDCIICGNARDCIERILKAKPDIVFVALHGGFGENGQLQASLETLGIKYTGCSFAESSLAMNKFATKSILSKMGIPVAEAVLINEIDDIEKINFYPVCLKPNFEGSSVGVNFAYNYKQVAEVTSSLMNRYGIVLAERKLTGKELTVGIVYNRVLPIIHIKPKSGFYDYKHKYTKGATEYIVPAPLEKRVEKLVKEVAYEAFKAIGCKSYARVDIILEGNIPYVLEINTIPGMTPTSLLPKAAMADGLSFDKLVKLLVEKAC